MNTPDTAHLNLARKWRSKDFDQVIGQDVAVKMLKNSLYLGQFFPVYLLSGQRGCGKTSTARIFAMAVNCQGLSAFQKSPKKMPIPCLVCDSCVAMAQGRHPDFFEIDAASHTGVDTIRNIIEACQLLPIMGSKKIYLIDEAHMLSKASCNALLKILEEPPRSVLFMLATTDPQKIIETVRSRCFQLFFKPVEMQPLLEHLVGMCTKENIAYNNEGLELIIQETDGSVRDAINLLEQVRFSSSVISKEAVLQVLGHLDDEHLITMVECVVYKKPAQLLKLLAAIEFESYSADFMWNRLITILRVLLWQKYGAQSHHFMISHEDKIRSMVKACTLAMINDMLSFFYAQEAVFMKTTSKHALLEMILLQLCQARGKKNTDDDSAAGTPLAFAQEESDDLEVSEDEEQDDDTDDDEEIIQEDAHIQSWNLFIRHIAQHNDPLMTSIFSQGRVMNFDASTGKLDVAFAKKLSFFSEWLAQMQPVWLPMLVTHCTGVVTMEPHFIDQESEKKVTQSVSKDVVVQRVPTEQAKPNARSVQPQPPQKNSYSSGARTSTHYASRQTIPVVKLNEQRFDVSDTARWPLANMLLKHFPGTITHIQEMKNG